MPLPRGINGRHAATLRARQRREQAGGGQLESTAQLYPAAPACAPLPEDEQTGKMYGCGAA